MCRNPGKSPAIFALGAILLVLSFPLTACEKRNPEIEEGFNFFSYENREADKLLLQSMGEASLKKRRERE